MPAERLSMRKVREVLGLRHALSLSYGEISGALGVGKTSANDGARAFGAIDHAAAAAPALTASYGVIANARHRKISAIGLAFLLFIH